MILDWISLENFRQYFGRQELTFARGHERRVTVIHGVNGAGKTSLFMAINWCLYQEGVENVGELVSKEAISQAEPGQQVQTTVELSFLHRGERYLLRRGLRGRKGKDGNFEVDPVTEFTMRRTRSDGQSERVKNPIGTMNAILPSNVRTYFLFDGEKIDNFAKPETSGEVKEAIYLVLKLEILDRAHRHLEVAAQEYRQELKKVSSDELRSLIERNEGARTERENAQLRLAELQAEIVSARRKIDDIDKRLRELENAKVLQQERDRIEKALEQRHVELDKITDRIRDLATGAYIIIAYPAVKRAIEILDEKRQRGEIPSSIRQQFVQDLIEQMRCICGRPFADGSPEHQRLLDLMRTRVPGALEDDVLDTNAALQPFGERAERHRQDLDEAMRQRTELVDWIRDLEAELDDVQRQLRGSPLEQVRNLEEQRQGFLRDIDRYNLEIGALAERIENLTREIEELDRDIKRARKDQRRELLLGRKLELAQQAADGIGKVYEIFADDMRSSIEAKTKEIFKQLVWKESHFQDIRLDENFNLEVIDRYGMPARPELSAGERQVLSLSFIAAMSRISDEEAPLVMDTPFGRLSSHHRNSITQCLPELADQLVLFVTDEELRDQARANLEPRIGAEYRLEFNRNTSCTEIAEVIR